jgi:tetratricopeptide (TPR) repeat protein
VTNPHDVERRVLDLWDFADPAASAERFGEAADAATDPSDRAVLLTQRARATGLAGDPVAAARLLDEVEALDQGPHARARLAIERGRVLSTGGDPAAAAPMFDAAYDLAVRAGTPGLAVDALHMSAIASGAVDGPEAALRWDERALLEAEASDDPLARRWRGPVLNNLGWDLHDAGRPAEALEVFQRAVEVRQEAGESAETLIARWCVGRALRTLGRYDEALAVMRQLAADPEGAKDPYVHEEIAENLAALGLPPEDSGR